MLIMAFSKIESLFQAHMKRHIKTTEDGSTTIYVPELDEHYHSTHGAIQESMHVFIEAGLNQISKNEISVFEMGFGTGLNCLLTWLNRRSNKVSYTSIEKYPVETDLATQLNFNDALQLDQNHAEKFYTMHQAEWDVLAEIHPQFLLRKIEVDIRDYTFESGFDLVYFDAFAPEVQPKLWKQDIFQKLFDAMNVGGILTTYCAKGVVRRTLQSVGFVVERLPGPPGKREMLRARKV